MAAPRSLRVCLAALALALCAPVRAEIFKFESELVPDGRSLVAKYLFYVYAHEDSPDTSKGHPYVQFADFDLERVDHGVEAGKHLQPGAIQLAVVPWEGFFALLDRSSFCSNPQDVRDRRAAAANQLIFRNAATDNNATSEAHVYTVPEAPGELAGAGRQALKKTGAYVLVVSNCGESAEGAEVTISGSVVVRNAYGFLPGNEYGRRAVFQWTSLAYFLMASLWLSACLRHAEELMYIHHCLAAVVAGGFVEHGLWSLHLVLLNADGLGVSLVHGAAILASGVRTAATLISTRCLCWRRAGASAAPGLDGAAMGILWMGALFVVLDFARMYIMELRQRFSLSVRFTLLCSAPAAGLGALFAVSAFVGISGLKRDLRERGQAVELATYERFTYLLVFTLLAALATLGLQICDLPGRGSEWWSYHRVSADAVSSAAGALFCCCMMLLWMPEEGGKVKAASQQIVSVEDEEEPLTGLGSTDEPESGPRPDTVGATLGDDA